MAFFKKNFKKELNEVKLHIKITGKLILLLTSIVLLFFLLLYSGDIIVLYWLILLSLYIILSFIVTYYAAVKFRFVQQTGSFVVGKGTKIDMKINIYNNTPFFYTNIKIFYISPSTIIFGKSNSAQIALLPRRNTEIKVDISSVYKGYFNLGFTSVSISDMLGIFVMKRELFNQNKNREEYPISLKVLPNVYDINIDSIDRSGYDKLIRNNNSLNEDVTMTSDLRTYAYGDSLKRINWKISSKMQTAIVKNYEKESLTQVLVYARGILNFDTPTNYHKQDHLAESIISIARALLKKQIKTDIFVSGKYDLLELNSLSEFEFLHDFFTRENVIVLDNPNQGRIITVYNPAEYHSIFIIADSLNTAVFEDMVTLKQSDTNIILIYYGDENNQNDQAILEKLSRFGITLYMLPLGTPISKLKGGSL